jgi:hypothetical protein
MDHLRRVAVGGQDTFVAPGQAVEDEWDSCPAIIVEVLKEEHDVLALMDVRQELAGKLLVSNHWVHKWVTWW